MLEKNSQYLMGTQITYSNKPGPVPYRHHVQVCLCKEDLGACLESFPFQTKTLQMGDKGEGGGGRSDQLGNSPYWRFRGEKFNKEGYQCMTLWEFIFLHTS